MRVRTLHSKGPLQANPFAAVAAAANFTAVYDADGNLTNDGVQTYTWDAENRLTTIESSTNLPASAPKWRIKHTYDDLHRLTSTLTEQFHAGNWVLAAWKAFHYDEGFSRLAETDITGINSAIPTGRVLNQSYLWGNDLGGTRHAAGGVGGMLAITLHKGPNAGTYSAFCRWKCGNP